MHKNTSIVIVLACMAIIMSMPIAGQRPKAAPVVAKFGGECQLFPFRSSHRLEQLIERVKQREPSPGIWPSGTGAFAFDLNGNRRQEFFVPLGCGATGNCTWGIFSDGPARLRGTFTAWFFYIHKRTGAWSELTTYTREGGDQGVIATLANHKGTYIQTTERTERGHYGDPQPFLSRMGVPECN